MTLPDLALQTVYARVAWALVLAALLCMAAPGLARRFRGPVAAGTLALMVLPGAASPAYWLTLAFQFPSGLLLGCSLVLLHAHWAGRAPGALLRPPVALVLAALGTLLYLDTFGVLALGMYHGGFGAAGSIAGASLLALGAVAGCAIAIATGRAPVPALALMTGLLLYALLRLPTGNLWDALLDPLLWAWAVVSLLAAGLRALAARRAAAGVRAPLAEPEPVALHAADIEQLQTVRE